MPMGIVTDEDWEKEKAALERISVPMPLPPKIIEQNIGRGIGSTEVPEEIRKVIGEVGILDSNGAKNLAESLGISRQQASAYSNGATSLATYNKPDKDLNGFLRKRKAKIAGKASSVLRDALSEITIDRLANAKLSEVADVASKMAGIIKNMEEPVDDSKDKKQQQNFVIFAPMIKSEDKFEVIHSVE